jgi:putative flippase GtrA
LFDLNERCKGTALHPVFRKGGRIIKSSRQASTRRQLCLRKDLSQIFRFGLVGLIATSAHMGVALLSNLGFGVAAQPSNFVAFCAAFLVSFIGHHNFSFRSRKNHIQTLPRFGVAAASGYLSSAVALGIFQAMGMPSGVSLLLSAGVVPAVSFLLNRSWVF